MIVITGSTGIGKSDVAVHLALRHNGEIISADSMQIYRGCNIGTGKITQAQMQGIPHHLIDILNPDQSFTAQNFRSCADKKIAEISERGKLPIVVGGTGFYIQSLLFDLDLGLAEPNHTIRDKYNKILATHGTDYIYKLLMECDEESARLLHPNDSKRVIRALEIFEVSGVKKSQLNSGKQMRYSNVTFLYLNTNRDALYNKINARVDNMFANGIVDEAKSLMQYKDCNSMQAIGYKEIFPYINGEISLDEAKELLKKNSRNYAKRQLTFYKKMHGIQEILIDLSGSMSDIVAKIEEIM